MSKRKEIGIKKRKMPVKSISESFISELKLKKPKTIAIKTANNILKRFNYENLTDEDKTYINIINNKGMDLK